MFVWRLMIMGNLKELLIPAGKAWVARRMAARKRKNKEAQLDVLGKVVAWFVSYIDGGKKKVVEWFCGKAKKKAVKKVCSETCNS